MAIGKGSKSVLAWKEETTYGVAPSGNWNLKTINNDAMDETINTVLAEDIRSDRTTPAVRGGNIAAGGNVVCDFSVRMLVPWLRHLLAAGADGGPESAITVPTLAASTQYKRGDMVKGTTNAYTYVVIQGGTTGAAVTEADLTVTTQGLRQNITSDDTRPLIVECAGLTASNDFYDHVLTAGVDWETAGIAIEKQIKGGTAIGYVQHLGCRVNSLELTVPQEGLVKATFNILAASSVKTTTSGIGTATNVVDNPAVGFNSYIHVNDSLLGKAAINWRDASMTISNQAQEDVYVVANRNRIEIPEGTRLINGRMTGYFADMTQYDLWKNETQVGLGFTFIVDQETLIIDIPQAKLTGSGSPKISGPGVVMEEFEFTGYKGSGSYDVKITSRNRTASMQK